MSRQESFAIAIAPHRQADEPERTLGPKWKLIANHIDLLKRLFVLADRQAIENDDIVPAATVERIGAEFRVFCTELNVYIGDGSTAPELQAELGARVHRELLPYMMMSNNGDRWHRKPRGYAGDFLSIEWIYQDAPAGSGRLGALLDRCFLDLSAAQAVRNRRGLMAEEIRSTMAQVQQRPTRVLSMACGPALELLDVFDSLSDPNMLSATCIDIDLQALAHVADVCQRRKLTKQVRLERANVIYLADKRQTLELPAQDLVYSVGLIDYFSDAIVVGLLDYIHDILRPGGRVILGNFHPKNPSKAFMDHVLDWRLIHRTEADMHGLFMRSKFGGPCQEIRYEAEGINLFAIGRRPVVDP